MIYGGVSRRLPVDGFLNAHGNFFYNQYYSQVLCYFYSAFEKHNFVSNDYVFVYKKTHDNIKSFVIMITHNETPLLSFSCKSSIPYTKNYIQLFFPFYFFLWSCKQRTKSDHSNSCLARRSVKTDAMGVKSDGRDELMSVLHQPDTASEEVSNHQSECQPVRHVVNSARQAEPPPPPVITRGQTFI